MTFKKVLLASIVTSIFAAGTAYAGPPVTVTFKNLSNETATYKIVTNNEVSTNASASPKPATTVPAKGSDIYRVQNVISPDANAAIVRYTIGSKTCVFGTTFVNTIIPGGIFNPGAPNKVPKWNKSAEGSGGAVCTATITSQSLSTYAWNVEFTMK
ncbi:hypothetical protein U1R68_02655 [Pectobacterium colocasium]|uniref:hypothetical protein n=1 Tax=Pectobacterium TaxID=122277 RepID=UPI001CD4B536|nr:MULTISPECIES: hypothetical protein [Pectobacterium]UYA62042.1 putative secreted protein [Pectobacterium sp. F1-1]